jgi:hypothetical protein
MFSVFFVTMLAVNLGPIGPDAAHEPQMAAKGSMVAMTFGAGTGIYFSLSRDAGKTFSTPIPVAEAAVLPLSRHRGPRIAFSRDAIVISAVGGRTLSKQEHAHGLPSDGDLIIWRSVDAGKSWSKGIVINDVPGAPTEGLHSLAADPQGNLFAAWLDKRTGHGTQLYGARSTDGGVTWSKNVVIYKAPEGTICECCHPSIAVDDHGQTSVMWRNVLDGSRDFYVSSSKDGVRFTAPQKLGNGTWKINACPMDGGGVVTDHAQLVSAWRREDQVFLAPLGKPETQIGTGKDVAMAAGRKGVYVAWSNAAGLEIHTPSSTAPKPLATEGAFVNLVALEDGSVLAAWEINGSIRTQLVKE